jgi:hypothetical protein
MSGEWVSIVFTVPWETVVSTFPATLAQCMVYPGGTDLTLGVLEADAFRFLELMGHDGGQYISLIDGRVPVRETSGLINLEATLSSPLVPAHFETPYENPHPIAPNRTFPSARRGTNQRATINPDAPGFDTQEIITSALAEAYSVNREHHRDATRVELAACVGRFIWNSVDMLSIDNFLRKGTPYILETALARSRGKTAAFRTMLNSCASKFKEASSNTIASRFVTLYLADSEPVPDAIRSQVATLASQYIEVRRLVRDSIMRHQCSQFVQETVNQRVEEFRTRFEKKKGIFFAYSKMFGGTPELYRTKFLEAFSSTVEPLRTRTATISLDSALERLLALEASLMALEATLLTSRKGIGDALVKKVEEALQQIISSEPVLEVGFEDNSLCVLYDDVFIDHGGLRYPLGKYKLFIPPFHNRPIRIVSLLAQEKHSDIQHPHVTHGGTSICWGNLRSGIEKVRCDLDLALYSTLIWPFLHSYTPHDRLADIEQVRLALGITPFPVPSDAVREVDNDESS